MYIFKNKFNPKQRLTPRQFYFPYFFDEYYFRELLSPFQLTTEVRFNEKTEMPQELYLKKDEETKVVIKFGQQLMIVEGSLIVWSTNRDIMWMEKIDLSFELTSKKNQFEIPPLEIGINTIPNPLGLKNFITFIRSRKIKYPLDFYEIFGILIINEDTVELIPFDEFNKKGGDYGYVWPAVAQLDAQGYLHGEGMRMDDFKVKVRE